jgi:hypothetical protein
VRAKRPQYTVPELPTDLEMVELRNQSNGHANASLLPVGERFDKNLVRT